VAKIKEKEKMKKLVVLIILAVLTVPALNAQDHDAVDFTAVDINGKRIRLSDFYDKVVLLDFWATWCPPCRREIPTLIEIKKAFRHKNFEIISIDGFERRDNAGAFRFVREKRMNWIHIIDKRKGKEIARMYGVEYIPATFVIKNGKIAASGLRGHELKATIRELVR
jgi:thiol-disulfide isomerase/thioredoxin